MLSRVAENFYWMGRYQERAENTARLIKVNTNLTLDLPQGLFPPWQPMVTILGCEDTYRERHAECSERLIVNFLVCDSDNPSSIFSSLRASRDIAVTIRDVLPREGWEAINDSYRNALAFKAKGLHRSTRQANLERTLADIQRITGVLAGSMNHGQAYDFLNLGRKIERADMTTRIIDVRADASLPDEMTGLEDLLENTIWLSILKSLSAYQMYRQKMRVRIHRAEVLDFLFRYVTFPRSVAYCADNISSCLSHLPGHEIPMKHLVALRTRLRRARLHKMDNQELHRYVDGLQRLLHKLHDAIGARYFPPV